MLLTLDTAASIVDNFIQTMPRYPEKYYEGRGIVTCAGGFIHTTNAWVLLNMLRKHGCDLPIEVWYLGEQERDDDWNELVSSLNVETVDAHIYLSKFPHPNLSGWELKSYAITHSKFQEVLFLDSDNVPVTDPTFLFDTPQYKITGAIFWPDLEHQKLTKNNLIWKVAGNIEYIDSPSVESGQILIDKKRCWEPLMLTNWYNIHSAFYYQFIHGDKDTFHMAWRKMSKKFSMPLTPPYRLPGTMCQHDFDGNRIFQHRNAIKWSLERNVCVSGFQYEQDCFNYLDNLKNYYLDKIDDIELPKLNILQICSSYGDACGISNFSRNMELALKKQGHRVQTIQGFYTVPDVDVVLIQHEWALYDTSRLYKFCHECDKPVIIFAHSPGTELFDELVDGYIVMCKDMLKNARSPIHIVPHPAWVPDILEDRDELKLMYGTSDYDVVIGSNGFIHTDRQFCDIVKHVVDKKIDLEMNDGVERKWFIDLITSRHKNYMDNEYNLHAIEEKNLKKLNFDFVRFGTDFLDREELSLRMQACDLLWCWTRVPSMPYGSGSVSDQYGSGTKIVVADKEQLSHIFNWPNVVIAPSTIDEFVDVLVNEVEKGKFNRHDPTPISWDNCASSIVDFLFSLALK